MNHYCIPLSIALLLTPLALLPADQQEHKRAAAAVDGARSDTHLKESLELLYKLPVPVRRIIAGYHGLMHMKKFDYRSRADASGQAISAYDVSVDEQGYPIVAISAGDRKTYIHNALTGEVRHQLANYNVWGNDHDRIHAITLQRHPQTKIPFLITADAKGAITVWNAATGKCFRTLYNYNNSAISWDPRDPATAVAARFHLDGSLVIHAGFADGRLRTFILKPDTLATLWDTGEHYRQVCHPSKIDSIQFHGADKQEPIGVNDGTLLLHTGPTARHWQRCVPAAAPGEFCWVPTWASYKKNGTQKIIAAAYDNSCVTGSRAGGHLVEIDPLTREETVVASDLEQHLCAPPLSVTLDGHGNCIALSTNKRGHLIKVWDSRYGTCDEDLTGCPANTHYDKIKILGCRGDERMLFTCNDHEVNMWYDLPEDSFDPRQLHEQQCCGPTGCQKLICKPTVTPPDPSCRVM